MFSINRFIRSCEALELAGMCRVSCPRTSPKPLDPARWS